MSLFLCACIISYADNLVNPDNLFNLVNLDNLDNLVNPYNLDNLDNIDNPDNIDKPDNIDNLDNLDNPDNLVNLAILRTPFHSFVASEMTGKLFLEDRHFSRSMNSELDLIFRSCSKRPLLTRRS
jgi:hypothetical protein